MERAFGNLSEHSHRSMELFRSVDTRNTAIYFKEERAENGHEPFAQFELLRFGYKGGHHQIYIRFPKVSNYFIEMKGGGFGSSWGDMQTAHGQDVWRTISYDGKFTIYSHGDNLLLSFGNTPNFNFMKRVAHIDNEYHRGPIAHNVDLLFNVMTTNYLKLPEDVRRIEYCFKLEDSIPKYFVIDYPAFNFQYDNHRFYMIENGIVKSLPITGFIRYRDGGTTIITIEDEEGKEHKFFSPTPWKENEHTRWNDVHILTKVSDDEYKMLIKLLQIEEEKIGEFDE